MDRCLEAMARYTAGRGISWRQVTRLMRSAYLNYGIARNLSRREGLSKLMGVSAERVRQMLDEIKLITILPGEENKAARLEEKKRQVVVWLGRHRDRSFTVSEILRAAEVNSNAQGPHLTESELRVFLDYLVKLDSGVVKIESGGEVRYTHTGSAWIPADDKSQFSVALDIAEAHLAGIPLEGSAEFVPIHKAERGHTYIGRFEMDRAAGERVVIYYQGPTEQHAKSALKVFRSAMQKLDSTDPSSGGEQ